MKRENKIKSTVNNLDNLHYIYLYTMRKQYIVYETNKSLYMRRKLLRSKIIDLVIPYFHFSFHFLLIYFHFSIFRTLGLGLEVIIHTVTSVTSDGVVTTLIMELEKRK